MTEIITIPESWKMQNILENSTLKARIGWQGLTTTEYKKTGKIYLVTGTDFKDGKIDWENCVYVDKKRYSQDKNIQIKIDDVLVTKDGTIGKIAYVDKLPLPTTLNSGIFVIRSIKNDYLHLFLFYILSSNYFIKFLNKLKAGSTIIHLYQKDFASFNFVVPPISEQQQIIQILSNTDKLIEKLEKIIEKKKNIKHGAMQELLTGGKRLFGFIDEWETKELGKIVDIKKGQQLNKSNLTLKGSYPVWNGGIEPSGFTHMCNELENTITISEGGNSCGFVNFSFEKFWCGGHCYALNKPKLELSKTFLYYVLKMHEKSIMKLRVGSGLPNIQKKRITEFPIGLPPFQEQIAIAEILSDINSEIKELENKRNKYVMIKNGMMQKLLTGEIRVK